MRANGPLVDCLVACSRRRNVQHISSSYHIPWEHMRANGPLVDCVVASRTELNAEPSDQSGDFSAKDTGDIFDLCCLCFSQPSNQATTVCSRARWWSLRRSSLPYFHRPMMVFGLAASRIELNAKPSDQSGGFSAKDTGDIFDLCRFFWSQPSNDHIFLLIRPHCFKHSDRIQQTNLRPGNKTTGFRYCIETSAKYKEN